MEQIASVLKALANETRLQMIGMMLQGRELCGCEFVRALGITQSKASRHLAELVDAGLVRTRRKAVWIYYSIVPDLDKGSGRLIDALAPLLKETQAPPGRCCPD
jgi:ArsR family transcriptional regulator, arsenate/arsenite/antimonite-responsive transcriptional repressor